MKPAFLQTEISTGPNADDHAFFANALANPPIPAGATLAQARDVLDSLASLNPAIPADVVVTQVGRQRTISRVAHTSKRTRKTRDHLRSRRA